VTKSSFDLEVCGQALAKPKLHRFLKKEYKHKGTVSVLTHTFTMKNPGLPNVYVLRIWIRYPRSGSFLTPVSGSGTSIFLITDPGSQSRIADPQPIFLKVLQQFFG
jgi:hypothetical protein